MAKLILKAPYYKHGHKTEDGRGRGGYAEYIATREGVELLRGGMVNYIGLRKGSCGLFSDEGVTVDLAKVSQEIDNHPGNVWALIFSLKREDAERLGYNSAAQWMVPAAMILQKRCTYRPKIFVGMRRTTTKKPIRTRI